MRKDRRSLLVFLIAVTCSLRAEISSDQQCQRAPRSYNMQVRHIEERGVGYKKGYSTFELFIAPSSLIPSSWIPFLDFRGHIFNDGEPALNTGLGLRCLTNAWVWGINSYYDYRKTEKMKYNQVSVGLEALGKVLDFRLNGYFPLGKKKSRFFDVEFAGFRGNHMVVHQSQEFAMQGANAEIGFHIKKMKYASFYGAIGPYYFGGQGKNAAGGEARLSGFFWDCLKAEINTSYDPVFKGIFQGQLGLVFPFGPRKVLKKKEGRSCTRQFILKQRALQSVDRNEIIVVNKKRKQHLAQDSQTGDALFFLFVDNTSHSKGTFESPFSTLAEAERHSKPGDIIYVFQGNGTTLGLDEGFTMKDNQKLWGSGMCHIVATSLGEVQIPQRSLGAPHITTSVDSADGVIILGNGCEVSGVRVISELTHHINAAILGGIKNCLIQYNRIEGEYEKAGICLYDCVGDLKIQNNELSSITSKVGLGRGIDVTNERGTINSQTVFISNNKISNTKGQSICVTNQGSSKVYSQRVIIKKNKVTNVADHVAGNSIAIQNRGSAQVASQKVAILDNTTAGTGNAQAAIFCHNSADCKIALQEAIISENTVVNTGPESPGIEISNMDNALITLQNMELKDNTIANTGPGNSHGILISNLDSAASPYQEIAVVKNIIFDTKAHHIYMLNSSPINSTVSIKENKLFSSGIESSSITLRGVVENSTLCAVITDNFIEDIGSFGIFAQSNGSSVVKVDACHNEIHTAAHSMSFISADTSKLYVKANDNKMNKPISFMRMEEAVLNVEPLTGNDQPAVGAYTLEELSILK